MSDDRAAVKHIFIINPRSFIYKSDMDAFIAECRRVMAGLEYVVHVSRYPRDAIGTIRRHVMKLEPSTSVRVYAVGGDGILFDCLNGIVGLENAELAPIPYGKSNDFVRAFGEGNFDRFRDIEAMSVAGSVLTDVLHCGNNYALNTCTIGMEAYATHKAVELNNKYRNMLKKVPNNIQIWIHDFMFFLSGIISTYDPKVIGQRYEVTIDDYKFLGNYATINIANGPCYGGDKYAAVKAMPNDGLLDVLLVKSASVAKILRIGVEYIYGKYYKFPSYITYDNAKAVNVTSKEPLVLQLDGENFFDTNITIKILPAAVRIIAPANLHYVGRAVNAKQR
jgi:YegS/Rv2252/BmrU family lipid kinase